MNKAILNCLLSKWQIMSAKGAQEKERSVLTGEVRTRREEGRGGQASAWAEVWMEMLFAFRIAVAMLTALKKLEAWEGLLIFSQKSCPKGQGMLGLWCGSVDFFPWLVQSQVFPEWAIHHKRRLFEWFVEELYSNLFYLHLVSIKPLLLALLTLFLLFWNDSCSYLGEFPQKLSHLSFLLWESFARCQKSFVLVVIPRRNYRANEYYCPFSPKLESTIERTSLHVSGVTLK